MRIIKPSITDVAAILMSSLRSSVVVTLPVPLFSAVRTLPFANSVLFRIVSLTSSDPKPTVNPLNMSSPFIRESELMVLELMLLLLPIRITGRVDTKSSCCSYMQTHHVESPEILIYDIKVKCCSVVHKRRPVFSLVDDTFA
ncbi:hypothetical protein GQX74_014009 [Glossina fuscipes]|nr:hypothetical protein GQX74_014009 [Glossina fuscipes]